jgi:hypothetical protein
MSALLSFRFARRVRRSSRNCTSSNAATMREFRSRRPRSRGQEAAPVSTPLDVDLDSAPLPNVNRATASLLEEFDPRD